MSYAFKEIHTRQCCCTILTIFVVTVTLSNCTADIITQSSEANTKQVKTLTLRVELTTERNERTTDARLHRCES